MEGGRGTGRGTERDRDRERGGETGRQGDRETQTKRSPSPGGVMGKRDKEREKLREIRETD